ncbi:MAG: class I SAM-dependent methyltransferase [Chloroflexi bacterium]|nr:MAG: class I SAM-dependent methyltransferase [Chloroflexota bacterium]
MESDSNLEEYADPVLYDLENREFEPDGSFFLTLARQVGGPVLELGCGTGRLTIPIAGDGISITGLDVVPLMLEHAKRKAQGTTIDWIEADVRTFSLAKRFQMIFESGSVFQHMLTLEDQQAFLQRVYQHLKSEGLFAFSVFFPQPDVLKDESEQHWFSYPNAQGQVVKVSGLQTYDPLRQVKVETAIRRWIGGDGLEIVHRAPLSLRFVFPQEIETLLHYNGFSVLERFGNWDRSPLTKSSNLMIYICKKR